MLTTLPDCPRCGELDLYRVPDEYLRLRLRCADCGWDSGYLALDPMPATAAELIAAAVEQERARQQAARGAT